MEEILEILQDPWRAREAEFIAYPAQLRVIWELDHLVDYERCRRTPVRRLIKKDAYPKAVIVNG